MKQFYRICGVALSIGGAIIWTVLVLKICKFLHSSAGWGDGATNSSISGVDVFIGLIVWSVPMLAFVALFRKSLKVNQLPSKDDRDSSQD
jgi:hypothetical protein